jgi:hypothetical protein
MKRFLVYVGIHDQQLGLLQVAFRWIIAIETCHLIFLCILFTKFTTLLTWGVGSSWLVVSASFSHRNGICIFILKDRNGMVISPMTLLFEPVSDVHKSRSHKNQLGNASFRQRTDGLWLSLLTISRALWRHAFCSSPLDSSKLFSPRQNNGPNMFLAIPNYRRLGAEDLLNRNRENPIP